MGLIPLFAVATLEQDALESMPSFHRRLDWFIQNRSDLTRNVACMHTTGDCERRLLSVVNETQLRRILFVMLDEKEFLSVYGIRVLSRIHEQHSFTLRVEGVEHRVAYEPGDSTSGTFGGNSNWRGPIWFPSNYLIIESLQKFHHYYGDDFQVECPIGSGSMLTLTQVAAEISRRLSSIFMRGETQMVAALKQVLAGRTTNNVTQEYHESKPAIYAWKGRVEERRGGERGVAAAAVGG